MTVDQRPGKAVDSRARVDGLIEFWNTYREKVDRVEGHQKSEATTLQIIHESRFTPIYIAFPVVWERMLRNLWRQKDVSFSVGYNPLLTFFRHFGGGSPSLHLLHYYCLCSTNGYVMH